MAVGMEELEELEVESIEPMSMMVVRMSYNPRKVNSLLKYPIQIQYDIKKANWNIL